MLWINGTIVLTVFFLLADVIGKVGQGIWYAIQYKTRLSFSIKANETIRSYEFVTIMLKF